MAAALRQQQDARAPRDDASSTYETSPDRHACAAAEALTANQMQLVARPVHTAGEASAAAPHEDSSGAVLCSSASAEGKEGERAPAMLDDAEFVVAASPGRRLLALLAVASLTAALPRRPPLSQRLLEVARPADALCHVSLAAPAENVHIVAVPGSDEEEGSAAVGSSPKLGLPSSNAAAASTADGAEHCREGLTTAEALQLEQRLGAQHVADMADERHYRETAQAELRMQHAAALASTSEQRSAELAARRSQHEGALEELREGLIAEHAKEIQTIMTEHQDRLAQAEERARLQEAGMAALIQQHSGALAQERARHAAALAQLEAFLEKRHNSEMSGLVAQQERAVTELKVHLNEDHSAQIAELQSQVDREAASLKAQQIALRESLSCEHAAELAAVRAQHEDALVQLRAKLQREQDTAVEELHAALREGAVQLVVQEEQHTAAMRDLQAGLERGHEAELLEVLSGQFEAGVTRVAQMARQRAAEVYAAEERLMAQHAAEMDKLRECLCAEHEAANNQLPAAAAAERLETQHAAEMAMLREHLHAQHKAATQQLHRELEDAKAASAARVEASRNSASLQEAAVAPSEEPVGARQVSSEQPGSVPREEHEAALATLQRRLAEERAAAEAAMQAAHEAAVSRLCEEHAERVQTMEGEHEMQCAVMEEMVATACNSCEERVQRECSCLLPPAFCVLCIDTVTSTRSPLSSVKMPRRAHMHESDCCCLQGTRRCWRKPTRPWRKRGGISRKSSNKNQRDKTAHSGRD